MLNLHVSVVLSESTTRSIVVYAFSNYLQVAECQAAFQIFFFLSAYFYLYFLSPFSYYMSLQRASGHSAKSSVLSGCWIKYKEKCLSVFPCKILQVLYSLSSKTILITARAGEDEHGTDSCFLCLCRQLECRVHFDMYERQMSMN